MADGMIQSIPFFLTGLTFYALISAIYYIAWKKRHDNEIAEKLEKIIHLLSKEK